MTLGYKADMETIYLIFYGSETNFIQMFPQIFKEHAQTENLKFQHDKIVENAFPLKFSKINIEFTVALQEYINSMKRQVQKEKPLLKSFESLESFKLNQYQKAQIYHNAVEIPQFLVDNLKSQHRVIKEFSGQDAILKAFYFNLMKLAFQLESEETDYTQLVQKVLIGQEQFGIGELEDKHFSDKQYRSFLRQFFDIVQNQQIPNIEEAIQFYPIIDQILMNMFRKLVPFTLKLKDGSDFDIARRIFEYLSKKFKITLQIIGGCFKFIQSDMFVYVDSVSHVYLIYMDQLGFIKQVTQDATSDYLNRSKQSNTQKSNNAPSDSKMLSQTQIKNKGNIRNSDKKVFSTVINMLDSKQSPNNTSKLSSSIKYRHSLEQDLSKQLEMFQKGSDRISEKDRSSIQEVSDISAVNLKPKFVSTMLLNKPQNPTQRILYSQTFPIKAQQDDPRFVTPPSPSLSVNNKAGKSPSSKYILIQPKSESIFQQEADIPNVSPILSKAQTYSQTNQNRYQKILPSRKSSNLESILKESRSKERNLATNIGQEAKQIKSPIDFFKKPVMPSQYSSNKLPSQVPKNINLQIFSTIKDKSNIFEPINNKFQNLAIKAACKMEGRQNKDNDNSYQKFTDSGLLQILDEEYRTRIKSIKHKYRQQRNKIQHDI